MSKDRPPGSSPRSYDAPHPSPERASAEGSCARVSDLLDDFLTRGAATGAATGDPLSNDPAVPSRIPPGETSSRISLGEIMDALGDRAFGALLLILSIPNVLPVPGLSTATGVPMILLGAQMALGRHGPWLPRRMLAASFDRKAFLGVIRRAKPWAERVERHLRPRMPALAGPTAERLLGLAVMVLAGILSLPIVFGNQPPAFAIALIALGLMESDGAFVSAGLIAGLLSIAIIAAVLLGLGQAAVAVAQQLIG
ncbi:exopolysaccharide biosynthesis protein [Azospirillum sp. CT11-132]|uniref:exopolysaccharide biosynthesis protein n=1 Tax=unclassified Azospirillum TaxID=2630922 RepID=UPI0010AA5FF7|nr:exopolysaccharide biosynthesis protein [Azospirillum sp. TSA2s]QCG95984.1 exopolysaccharide biosynthesis protein [Azospirillum sp. TSA2s]